MATFAGFTLSQARTASLLHSSSASCSPRASDTNAKQTINAALKSLFSTPDALDVKATHVLYMLAQQKSGRT
ncbi:MAG: hypothetical protein COC24_001165 [Alphaproteobacteria bacterium]|nr:hypothetical protein [Alphaproteobacteria bacterium]